LYGKALSSKNNLSGSGVRRAFPPTAEHVGATQGLPGGQFRAPAPPRGHPGQTRTREHRSNRATPGPTAPVAGLELVPVPRRLHLPAFAEDHQGRFCRRSGRAQVCSPQPSGQHRLWPTSPRPRPRDFPLGCYRAEPQAPRFIHTAPLPPPRLHPSSTPPAAVSATVSHTARGACAPRRGGVPAAAAAGRQL